MSNYPTTERPINRESQKRLTQEVLSKIANGRYESETSLPYYAVEFYGIEGVGKTRVLNVVKELCEARQLPFVIVEAAFHWQDTKDNNTLVSEFLRSICEQLGKRSEIAYLSAHASSILENIQRGSGGEDEFKLLVKDFVGILVDIQRKISSPLILLLDKTEYFPQTLFNWLGEEFIRLFLGAEFSPGMILFLAGRGRRIRESSWSGILKQASIAYAVDPLNFADTGDHINALASGGHYKPATKFIYDLSNGHPYSTEMIVYELDRLGVKVEAVEEHRIEIAEKLYVEVIRRHILEDAGDWVRRFIEIASIPRWFKPDILKKLFNTADDVPEELRSADSAWVTHKLSELRNPPLSLVAMTHNAYEVERSLRKLLQKTLSILHTHEYIKLNQKIKEIYSDSDSLDPAIVREILFHTGVVALLNGKNVTQTVENELQRQLNRFDPKLDADSQRLFELRVSLDTDVELLDLLEKREPSHLSSIVDAYCKSARPLEIVNLTSIFNTPAEYYTSWNISGEVEQAMYSSERIYTHQRYEWDEWKNNTKETGAVSYRAYLPREAGEFLSRHDRANLQLVINYSHIPWELFHDNKEYLCLQYPMARKPQINERVTTHHSLPDSSMRALVVGNPTEDLPASEQEAEEIAAMLRKMNWQVDILIKDKATVNTFAKKISSTPYRLIHYAGHAHFNKDAPQKSSLMLKDYPWLAEEFERQLCSPAFIYLSACQASQAYTMNNAQSPRGEFMEGVAISALRGGAKGCLGPLWGVRDDWAREFALLFYKYALSGETLGESVRRSRLSMKERGGNFWAGWVLYGNPSDLLCGSGG